MKKKVFLFVILIVMLVLALCGCKKLVPGDSTILYDPKADGMEIVKNLDSYDVMQEAFTYYK
ncbi:MAG: hypothetical protein K2P12_04125, partial [Clostridia bacterium]|nr:hypothetical protein [Clostridia bacterium]